MARLSVVVLFFALIALSSSAGIPPASLSRSSASGARPYFAVPAVSNNNHEVVKRQCSFIMNTNTGKPECIFG
ncbi:hypothetical protein QR680_003684 [Steinernema hermaphroditum]|uniref:Uncharacterized protein n=1 Tax=Steinernema hermaphroditum TaxID=289476 RepID=A0AA39HM70_9BILA|nr:hypothetical protein QR680_003684 [Steinernema hermaphroditum]